MLNREQVVSRSSVENAGGFQSDLEDEKRESEAERRSGLPPRNPEPERRPRPFNGWRPSAVGLLS